MDRLPRPAGRRPKRGRLSRSAEFERVYRQGRSVGNRFLVLHSFPRPSAGDDAGAPGVRLGVSVSRRVGGAVDRNRVKRLLREAFAVLADRLPDDHDVVVVARPEVRELAERDGLDGVRGALEELVDRSVATSGGTEASGTTEASVGADASGEAEASGGTDAPPRTADAPPRASGPVAEDASSAPEPPEGSPGAERAGRGAGAPPQDERS